MNSTQNQSVLILGIMSVTPVWFICHGMINYWNCFQVHSNGCIDGLKIIVEILIWTKSVFWWKWRWQNYRIDPCCSSAWLTNMQLLVDQFWFEILLMLWRSEDHMEIRSQLNCMHMIRRGKKSSSQAILLLENIFLIHRYIGDMFGRHLLLLLLFINIICLATCF